MDRLGPVPSRTPDPKAADPATAAQLRRARQVATDVEAIFLHQLIGAMRASSPRGGTLLGGQQKLYRDMMDEQLANSVAKGGGLGLADLIVRDVLRRSGSKISSSPPARGPIGGGRPNPAQGDQP